MKRYSVYGKLTVKSGHQAELLDYLTAAATGMEQLASCYCNLIGVDEADPDSIYVFEVWESPQAHRESLDMEVFQDLIARTRPIIDGIHDYLNLTIVGGKARF